MITDFKQPANHWIADCIENFKDLLQSGEDPTLKLNLFGVEFELRLNKLPGVFERHEIDLGQLSEDGE